MAREIPEVVRAAAGLAATVLDEARKLPETLPGLPVRVIGLAMQTTMKIQQQYAGLVARGDELFTGLRGEDEPGLATFDDEIDDGAEPAATGYRESAFDRAELPIEEHLTEDTTPDRTDLGDSDLPTVDLETVEATSATAKPVRDKAKKAPKAPAKKATATKKATTPRRPRKEAAVSEAEVATPPAEAQPEAVVTPVESAAEQVEGAQQALDTLPAEAPSTDEVLEELAIEELVADAPVAGPVDTTTDTPAAPAATATDNGGGELPRSRPAKAPIEGYDGFSIAQLRGRLRGYQLVTVQDLLSYETANRARAPYLRMLRNRLEKVEQQAVESSPLAPRS